VKQFRAVDPRSDAERIAAARAIGITHRRESQARASNLGFNSGDMTPTLFQDRGFGSPFRASRICFLAELISTTLAGKDVRFTWRQAFNPWTGIFEDDTFGWTPFALTDLQGAFLARIHELGISHALLEEWASTIHSLESERKLYDMGFDERMDQFKLAQR
jgi:hypothetical protein